MKTKILQIIVTLFSVLFYQNQIIAQEWEFVSTGGGSGFEEGYNISVDVVGNVYMTGSFSATADFGSHSVSNEGYVDIFVAKMDASGNWIWATSAGGTSVENGVEISTTTAGESYVTGNFQGTVSFGPHEVTSIDGEDVFVAKIDYNGNWLWAVSAGGVGVDRGIGISHDMYGNSYVSGPFNNDITFGSITLNSNGYNDVFIAKLDVDGNWLWAKKAGGTMTDTGLGIVAEETDNMYITGYYEGTATFGPFNMTSSGAYDIYLAKLDTDGNWLWVKSAGGSASDNGVDICIDGNENVYISGNFMGSAYFDAHQITSSGLSDLFVAKYDSSGTCIWVQSAGGTQFDDAYDIIAKPDGSAYITGGFKSATANFGDHQVSTNGDFDVLAAKIDTDGNWVWANSGGGSNYDYGRGIAVYNAENVFVSGKFFDAASFGDINVVSAGFVDVFIAKILDSTISVEDLGQTEDFLNYYPNPFQLSTSITYNLKDQQSVRISFFNQYGKLVDVYEEASSKGPNTFEWTPKGLLGGVYYFSLEAEGQTGTGKLLFIK